MFQIGDCSKVDTGVNSQLVDGKKRGRALLAPQTILVTWLGQRGQNYPGKDSVVQGWLITHSDITLS